MQDSRHSGIPEDGATGGQVMTHLTRAQEEEALRERLQRAELMVERVHEDRRAIDDRLFRALGARAAAIIALNTHVSAWGES